MDLNTSRAPFVAVGLALSLTGASYTWAQPEMKSYVVSLDKRAGSANRISAEYASQNRGQVGYVYSQIFSGFTIRVPEQAVEKMRSDKRVLSIVSDVEMSAFSELPTGIRRVGADKVTVTVGETQSLFIDGKDDLRVDADIAILDTGIDYTHPHLNVVNGVNCLVKSKGPAWSATYSCRDNDLEGAFDGNGHGTHAAGSAAAIDKTATLVDGSSRNFAGVAPGARLTAVKVLDDRGSGSFGSVLAGLDWIANQNGAIDVVNMSLGGPSNTDTAAMMETAIEALLGQHTVVVVAAGNDSQDASNFMPANAPSAITVSALNDSDGAPGGDSLADFSNFGDVIDLIAPGVNIVSTYPNSSIATLSGTSMAAPHVAGAAALLASTGVRGTSAVSQLTDTHTVPSGVTNDPDLTIEPLIYVEMISPNVVVVAPEPEGGGGTTDSGTSSPTRGKGKNK